MTSPSDPFDPPEVEPTKQPNVALWLRIKRLIIGGTSITIMAWAIFATYMVIRKPGLSEGWPLLALTSVLFCFGVPGFGVALRGSNEAVDNFGLIR